VETVTTSLRASLFITCTADVLYPSTARAAVRVLEALGVTVEFPEFQGCCGQPWLNTGYSDGARRLARHFLEVFEDAEVVVALSSSCADAVRNHTTDLFPESHDVRERLEAVGRRTYEFCEYLHEVLGTPPGLDIEGLVTAARHALRERFLSADLGITGANFAVADTGTLVLVTNEGNGRMTTTLPAVQIAIVGIDKIIPGIADLPDFLKLLIRSATGQVSSSYVTVITGPRRPGEEEGPEALHVVLLDNGRSALAGGPFREMLHCLHCGACLNACPVYQAVGGRAYESVYPGLMGDVISPLLWGMEAFSDLPDACTLCGRCAEVCPMRIPLPDFHRKLRVLREEGKVGATVAAHALASAAACPALYQGGLGVLRRFFGKSKGALGDHIIGGLLGNWALCRDLPRSQKGESFRTWWGNRRQGLR
jgi:L-lactate dehydrogenase complex protein LldF